PHVAQNAEQFSFFFGEVQSGRPLSKNLQETIFCCDFFVGWVKSVKKGKVRYASHPATNRDGAVAKDK
ncbi:MAG: hypothetical protein KDA69_16085, partial [Planctomycetaceae bacterium]|nr:hypothetical protein [Planctomycetaceae bacterium]